MKIMDYLELRDKLTISTVSLRLFDIFSDFHFTKNLVWRINRYIHPDIFPLDVLPKINHHRFLNIVIDDIEAVNKETYLQLFTIIGRHTTYLKLNSRQPKSLLRCFPVLESLEMNHIEKVAYYNEFPSTLTTIKVKETGGFVWQPILTKLDQMENLKTLIADNAYPETYADEDSDFEMISESEDENGKEVCLFRLTDEFEGLYFYNGSVHISTPKSLLHTTIKALDVTQLKLRIWHPKQSIEKILKRFHNLEQFTYILNTREKTLCLQIHDVIWPNLHSLVVEFNEYCAAFERICENCLIAIKTKFPKLRKLVLTPNQLENEITMELLTYSQFDEIAQSLPFITEFQLDLTEDRFGAKLQILTHFHQLKKLSITSSFDYFNSILALENFPSLPHLEELNLGYLKFIPDHFDFGCPSDSYSEVDDCIECGYNREVREVYILKDWRESPFCRLALKCPNVKSLEFGFFMGKFDQHTAFAALNVWPKIQSLQVNNYVRNLSQFIDFLQEQKKQGWKPPSLKIFKFSETRLTI